jgi:hypothetical protein
MATGRGSSATRAMACGLAVGLLGFAQGCSNEHFVVGDSYASIMEPYVSAHTGCPVHDFSHSGRLAAEVLSSDLDDIAAEVRDLDPYVRPVVLLSAGALDEALWGPDIAAAIVDELATRLLALHPDLVIYQLDYGENFHLRFWSKLSIASHPRWRRVMFPDLVDHELSDDGLHLPKPAYVERLMSIVKQDPSVLCPRPDGSYDPDSAAPITGFF